jgi:hypothetical protein
MTTSATMLERVTAAPAEPGCGDHPHGINGDWATEKFALLCVSLYAIAVAIAFGKALQCGFLADDFVALQELKRADFLSAAISAWQPTNFQSLYRPVAQLSLMVDHLVWGHNAVGYHVSNLLMHISTATFLALCVRLMARIQHIQQPHWLGLVTGLIFAVAPLHCESIIWITGRVDLLASLFFTAAFWCFLKAYHGQSALHRPALPFLLAAAVLSKESAVVLPAVAISYACILPRAGESMAGRLKLCLKLLVPTFLVLVFWLAVRYIVLGTFMGGYLGLGQVSLADVLGRIDVRTLWRLFYPFNNLVVSDGGPLSTALRAFYLLFSVRVVLATSAYSKQPMYFRLLGFGVVSSVIALIPVAPFAYLATDGLGSRFFYTSSLFLSLCLACLLVPVDPTLGRCNRRIQVIAAAFLVISFIILRAVTAVENASAWVAAGELTQHLKSEIRAVISKLPPHGKLLYVNPPRQYKGAHVCYNATMLSALLEKEGERVLSLQPRYYWNKDPISTQQLEQFAQRRDIVASVISRAAVPMPERSSGLTRISCESAISDAGAITLQEKPTFFQFDVENVPGAQCMVVQISKPNQSFSLFDWRACEREVRMLGVKGTFWLSSYDFMQPGIYEMRVAAADSNGDRLEPLSDVLVLKR